MIKMAEDLRVKCDQVFFEAKDDTSSTPGRTFQSYEKAKQYQNEVMCDSDSEFSLITHLDLSRHSSLSLELITKYHESNARITCPEMVFFPLGKEYAIMPKKELTAKSWLENPYTDFGNLDEIERMMKSIVDADERKDD